VTDLLPDNAPAFSIHFGPFLIGITSSSFTLIERLKRFFSGYESNIAPDFVLVIESTQKLPPPVLQWDHPWIPLVVKDNSFVIGPQLIQGRLDMRKRLIKITVHDDFFKQPTLNIFQNFLYRMYHTLCLNQGIRSHFIHGCGVQKEIDGYLFIGPHQSGKTTIGELSNAPVLHDDQMLITIDERGISMDSPPLPAKHRYHPEKPVPLRRIFVIFQNSHISTKIMEPLPALKNLYSEVVLPLTLDSLDQKEAKVRKSQFCFDILKLLPVRELHFDEHGKFWQEINS